MPEVVIRPTMKFIKAGYILTLVIVGAIAFMDMVSGVPAWVSGVAALLFLWPIGRHLRRQMTKVTIAADKLRYESGFLSKTTRNIQLSKVQDVSVHQSLGQRMAGTGDLSIETAGESSRLTVASIDGPQAIADEIIEASKHAGRQEGQPGFGPAKGPLA